MKRIDEKNDYVILGNNLGLISELPDESVDLIYIDPPFNTGKIQKRVNRKMVKSDSGTQTGFKGQTYLVTEETSLSYGDIFDDYWAFLAPRLDQTHRLLKKSGTLYLHLDYREVHYAKVYLDQLFGRENFLNEIIWAYDYGARAKRKWPTKHDNILVYVKDVDSYHFSNEEVDREPYMAPGLVTPEKVALGKLPTDVWWHTIVSPTGKEKTGYATQKPEGILRRIITASSKPGDLVLDFFAGSGTTGAVAKKLDRKFIMIDENLEAVEVMKNRLEKIDSSRPTLIL